MSEEIEKSIHERLKEARINAGFRSASNAAERVGKSMSTYRAHENGQNDYSIDDARVYASAFGVTSDWLLFGGNTPFIEWKKQSLKAMENVERRVKGIAIIGTVAAGLWRDADIYEEETYTDSSVLPDKRFPARSQYLTRVDGESLNKIAQNGDLLWCVDYLESGLEMMDGDVAIIERSRDGGHTIERTAKRIVRTNGTIELRPESTDPRFQESVVYDDVSEEFSEVVVKSKVIFCLKPV